MPGGSPCFLPAENFFSRIVTFHAASENIKEENELRSQILSGHFPKFPHCLLSVAKKVLNILLNIS
jgi:hypothetical protein